MAIQVATSNLQTAIVVQPQTKVEQAVLTSRLSNTTINAAFEAHIQQAERHQSLSVEVYVAALLFLTYLLRNLACSHMDELYYTHSIRKEGEHMGLILWILFGAIAGWIASLVMKTDWEQGTLADIVLGIVGALIGGFIMEFFGYAGVTGFNLYSLFVAVLGSAVVIYLGRLLHR